MKKQNRSDRRHPQPHGQAKPSPGRQLHRVFSTALSRLLSKLVRVSRRFNHLRRRGRHSFHRLRRRLMSRAHHRIHQPHRLRRVPGPPLPVFRQQLQHQRIQPRPVGHLRPQPARRLRSRLQVLKHPPLGVFSMEARLSGQHLVQHPAQRIQIRPPIHLRRRHTPPLLWRGIVRRQHHALRLPHRRHALPDGRDPKIQQLGRLRRTSRARQQNILRLHIAMHDAFAVRRAQSQRHPPRNRQRPFHRKHPPGQRPRQIRPFHILHRDIRRPILGLIQVVDLRHVRVPQLARRLRLLPEPLQKLRVLAQIARDEFERPLPPQQQMLRLVHRPHPAPAQLAHNPVLAANHRPRLKLLRSHQARAIRRAGVVVARVALAAYGTSLHRFALFLPRLSPSPDLGQPLFAARARNAPPLTIPEQSPAQ